MNKALTIVVIGVVQHEDKILVGKKIVDSEDAFLTEKWHMPGGSLNKNEDEFIGVAREVKEEAGIDIVVKELLGERIEEDRGLILKWFLCEPKSTEIKAGDDLAEVKFVLKEKMFESCSENVVNQWPEKVVEYFK